MTQKKQYSRLDYFRLAAAFLVVAIHTSPFASLNADADFIVTRVFARTAVPFFLMTTGYFLLPQYVSGRSMDKRPLIKALKKHLLLYLGAVLLYLPVNLYAGQLKGLSAGGFLRIFFIDGTFYHLWYLPAAVSGILIVWFLGTILSFRALTGISLALYLIGLFGDSYYGLAERIPLGKAFYDLLFSISSHTRNGLFYAPVFLVMGAGARGKDRERGCINGNLHRGNGKRAAVLEIVFLGLMTAEALLLRRLNLQRHDSMYMMLLPVMYFLFRIFMPDSLPEKSADSLLKRGKERRRQGAERLRGISACIYLIHPFCIILVRGAAKAAGLESLFVENSLLHYLAVCTVSCAGACAIVAASKKAAGRGNGNDGRGRAWIEINRENLAKNVALLQSFLTPGQQLMPALKADAYGHGAVMVAKELQGMGVDAFCVACAAEGIELRKNGITGDILILGYTHPRDLLLLRKYRLIQTVVDCSYGSLLNRCAGHGGKIRVHVKIDTGMHRLGERAEKMQEIGRIFRLKNLKVEGIYTHLCADETRNPADAAFTKKQATLFYEVADKLKKLGYTELKVHLLASYGLINYPELGGDYVRTGIALYGMLSDRKLKKPVCGEAVQGNQNALDALVPVLSLKARIAAVKEIYPGESVGYGCAYVAEDTRKIAVLAIGYADGLPRSLSDGVGRVLIHGQSASIVGRICMDQTMVDITGIADVKTGECATVIGKDGRLEITAYELAEKAGTITNEILSRLGARLQRTAARIS